MSARFPEAVADGGVTSAPRERTGTWLSRTAWSGHPGGGDFGVTTKGKKAKVLVKKALLATAEIEATARQLKDLYAPAGKKKKAAPPVLAVHTTL